MRKLLSVLFSTIQRGVRGGLLLVALLATTTLWAYDFQSGDLYYTSTSSSEPYTVEVSDAESSITTATIPEIVTYNGITYSVTSIGVGAFYNCSSLTSITIPNSVTSIGDYAFHSCSSLTSVTIGNSVTSIGSYAFQYCSSLTSVTIPNSVTSIGRGAFQGCSFLTSVTIGNSVTSIGSSAFSSCSSLTSMVVERGNTKYDSRNNCNAIIETATNTLIAGCQNTIILNSVTSIGDYAFGWCSSLTSITIPNSVTSIGNYAFYNCDALTSITIPNSVTSIGGFAFGYCSSLTSVTIPNSVTSIGSSAFRECSSLTSLTIPNSVTSIGYEAFQRCSSLTSITIPNSVTSIGGYAFAECSSLTSITIPNSVTSIGNWTFGWCSSLTSITIPNSVTSIGNYAFYDCSGLTSITCEATTPPTLGDYVFYPVSHSIPVYVPCGCVSAYKAASTWKDFTNIQEPQAEYSIQVFTSNSQMGSAKVDYNTFCDGSQITATANYGYHFAQWSDGNTDNPRTLTLTSDTILIAEFAPNKYTISTQCNDTERGTTSGDITAAYLDYVMISATANYGYHFSYWDNYIYDNPRQVQVTEAKMYTAYFDKNTYYITKNYDSNQGYVNGSSSGEYLDNITLTAEPNCGYHFVQWSDGVTDNPRTFTITQDTAFTAQFAQSYSGQCGDNLYWSCDEMTKIISITGSGNMYDYTADTQPWVLFKEQIVEVTTTNTVTSIGTSAFEGCIRLGKVTLGSSIENIAAKAFAGCTRLYDVYCYATYPPFADATSFANYNAYLYVPCENQRDYTLDMVWGNFKFIECITSEDVSTDGVVITPTTNDVTIIWPTEIGADTYTIVIKKGNEVFCTLTFNADGQLLNIAFAPGRNGNHPAQYAEQVGNGYRFTVTGLEEGTRYTYNIDVKNAANKTIKSHTGEFTTESMTAVENITTNNANIQKILRDGQLLILRDGVEYTIMGQEL